MRVKRIAAAALAVAVSLFAFSPQALAASSKNETVYAMLGADGSVSDIYVVNQLIGEYADYGDYTDIKNLSTASSPQIEGDRITFPDGEVDGGLYYQGTTQGELPFAFEIGYCLGGKQVTAQELAGASGSLEIRIKGGVNERCGERVREGYMAQITLALDADRAKNITSADAVMVAAGKAVNISYVILPGNSAVFSLKADVKDFEMDAISITLLKGTMAGMEDTVSETEDGFDDMLSGASDMVDGTYELKDGMKSLAGGLKSLNSGMGKLSSSGDDVLAGMKEYSAGLKSYTGGVASAAAGSQQIKDGLNELASGAPDIAHGVSDISSGLGAMYSSSGELKALAQSLLSSPDPSVRALAEGTLQTLESVGGLSSGLESASDGLDDFASGVQAAASGYRDFDAGLSELAANGTQLSGGYDDITDGFGSYLSGVKSSAKGVKKIYSSVKGLPGDIQKLIDGQIEFKDGISDAKDEILSRTENFIADDSPAVSFASPGKNHPKSVQYILRTAKIAVPEKAADTVTEKENETFFTRLADLFG